MTGSRRTSAPRFSGLMAGWCLGCDRDQADRSALLFSASWRGGYLGCDRVPADPCAPLSPAFWRAATWGVSGSKWTSVPRFFRPPGGPYPGCGRALADLCAPLFSTSWRAATWGVTGSWPIPALLFSSASRLAADWGVPGSWRTSVPRFFQPPSGPPSGACLGPGEPLCPASLGLLAVCFPGCDWVQGTPVPRLSRPPGGLLPRV